MNSTISTHIINATNRKHVHPKGSKRKLESESTEINSGQQTTCSSKYPVGYETAWEKLHIWMSFLILDFFATLPFQFVIIDRQ
jgi:hypothetical protein